MSVVVNYVRIITFLPRVSKQNYTQRLCTLVQRICWKCGYKITNMFCESCKVLQRPNKNVQYFDLLGISYSYSINIPDLVSKYHRLQNVLHPDKFTNKSEEERTISEHYSSLVNKAYSTLLNPMDRGVYMLCLCGKDIGEDSMSSDKTLLMDIMELNEELESICDENHMKNFSLKIEELLKTLIIKISDAFENEDIENAKNVLVKMKYYTTIKEKIKERKQSLNIPD